MSKSIIDNALTHFKQSDAVMHSLLHTAVTAERPIVIPTARPTTVYFESVVSSIISQQISVKAASAVRGRVLAFLGGVITPEAVTTANPEKLKACGLSAQKTKYVVHNALVWPEIPYQHFKHMPDEEIITELTKLYGIGRWTAEMFLLSTLARPDVFSYGDHGLMQGLYQSYNYKPHYVRKIRSTVDSWSPYKSLACLALWHAKDNQPALL